jgi:hypothetical protein
VDLFVRSLSPVGARTRPAAVIEHLENMVEAGVVDTYSVCVWGKEVELSSAPGKDQHTESVVEQVESFRTWATEQGVALDAFEEREVSTMTGETHTVLTLPVMVLAESVAERLVCVTPCTTGGGVLTVEDRLESLDTDGQDIRLSEDGPSSWNDGKVGPHQLDAAQP